MDKICTNCGNEFEAKRETAKYCSTKCRMAHSRVSVTDDLSVTKSNVTVNNETRSWLIRQFKDEGKSFGEIEKIMEAQDNYYGARAYYFIPARMIKAAKTES